MVGQEERKYISSFRLQIKFLMEAGCDYCVFWVCTFNLCKTKAHKIKVKA